MTVEATTSINGKVHITVATKHINHKIMEFDIFSIKIHNYFDAECYITPEAIFMVTMRTKKTPPFVSRNRSLFTIAIFLIVDEEHVWSLWTML